MNAVILSKTYNEPPFCEAEILRYAACNEADTATAELLNTCMAEARNTLTYKVCYREVTVNINRDVCDFDVFKVRSKNLAFHLNGCNEAIVFAATIGVGIDRLIAKYGHVSPSKALMFQAMGAERIERLCDTFCADIAKAYTGGTKPRFSPGYGDLPLTLQKDIFSVLDCEKRIGLTLNSSLLMSPSKSVTAIVGLSPEKNGI